MEKILGQEITFDCENIGLDHHHPDFKVLFNGYLWGKAIFQNSEEPNSIVTKDDTFIGHNIKFDLKCLLQQKYSIPSCNIYDTQIAIHLLREDLSQPKGNSYYKLKNLAHIFYEYPNYKYLVNFNDSSYSSDISLLKLYNKHDLIFTKKLKDLTEPALKRRGKWPLFLMMMEYAKTLTQIEMKGVKVNESELTRQGAIWTAKRSKCIEELRNYGLEASEETDAGVGRNAVIEYFKREKVKLPKTDKGNSRANESALKQVDHPVAKLLLKLREANKQLGTYIEGFKAKIHSGIYYPDYSLVSTVTGRLSEHFIQVMPRKETSEFKKCIVSKFPGGFLLEIDWSRLEALLAAEMFWIFTGKHKLADDLESGYDIHNETLQRFKFLPDRTRAKNANFSTIFGGRGYTLVQEYGFTWPQAKEFVNDLTVVRYPEMSEFFNMRQVEIINKGYVEHPYTKRGRHTTNYNEGLNAPVQGVGSDFNKIMTITLHDMLSYGYESHVCMEVHDSIIVDVKPEEKEEVIDRVKEEYLHFRERFFHYFNVLPKLNYTVEMKIGKNLWDMQKI